MSVAQLKTTFLSFLHRHDSEHSRPETFGSKVRRAYQEGKFNEQIQKAEIDYAAGRALDRLY